MNQHIKNWVRDVNKYLKQNDIDEFMYNQLPEELKNQSMLQKAYHRGYIRRIKRVQPEYRKGRGDRVAVWVIAKGV